MAGSIADAGESDATPASHAFEAIGSNAAFPSYSTAAARNGYVVLQAWQTERMHELKRQNPNLKVLVYKNLGFAAQGAGPEGLYSSGVGYEEAKSAWFLQNTEGRPFTGEGYPWLWAMDVGNREYQEKWTANVVSELTSKGWDGVELDDACGTLKYHYDPSQVAKYPTDAKYAAAMESALAYIGPAIQATGKLAIPNFACWVEEPSMYDRWLSYVSGGIDEMFVKWGSAAGEGYRDAYQWQVQVEEARYANRHGKVFIGFTQGAVGDTQAARYGYASLLMGSESAALSSYAYTPDYDTEQWLPEYEYELGAPTGVATEDAGGVFRRTFTDGLVLVNPGSSARTVSFGGTYSGSGLEDATGATLGPHSALVLTGQAAAPVTATTPAPAPEPTPEPTPARPKMTPKASEAVAVGSIGVTVSTGEAGISLSWSSGAPAATTYEVIRDEKALARTSRRHRREPSVKAGRNYRYLIVGYDRRGKVVARSRRFAVKASSKHRRTVVQAPSKVS
ncbi:MAG TPA: putative glycoside hydrolase [Solirubrobacterales bacterium]|nr:putative glycoside hydrolase [Solirubrobacterales bacterium]